MSSFRDTYSQADEDLFGRLSHNSTFQRRFVDPNAMPHEDVGQIQPVGWVQNSNGSGASKVEIDARGITIVDGAISVTDTGGNTSITGGVIQRVSNSGATVVINSSGITITGGAMTVTNPAGTVIIDGTSNMFKIVATGTQAATGPNGPAGSTETLVTTDYTLNLSYTPANLCMIEFQTNNAIVGHWMDWYRTGVGKGTMFEQFASYSQYLSSTQSRAKGMWRVIDTLDRSAYSVDFRYYILKEAAF